MKTVVLFSGGLDSTTVLAQCLAEKKEVYALSINYHQSNAAELGRCNTIAAYWGFPHKTINVEMMHSDARGEIPARNTVFLAKALEYALTIGATEVAYGAEPDATYTDSSKEYIKAMDELMMLHGVNLIAPIRTLNGKADVLRLALALGVPLDLVHSSRTNRLDGGDKASGRYLKTVLSLFPNINPLLFLQEIAAAHVYTNQNPFHVVAPQTGSFKYLPALFVLSAIAGDPQSDLVVYTTGNWGLSLTIVNNQLHRYRSVQTKHTQDVGNLGKNLLNTNHLAAQWGMKQMLSRLPRPRYLGDVRLSCRVTQGHLRMALEDLGYTFGPEGLPLVTESECRL